MDIREFKLERYMAQHEFSAPYLLCTSDCESMSVSELLSLEPGSEDLLSTLHLGYTESQGSPALRSEIASWYDQVSAEDIVVTSGAEEGIFIAMHTLLRPGDHVIVQTPAYQSLHEVPRSIGCHVSAWEMTEREGSWHADIDTLISLITPQTRLLVINAPHNPTGYTFSYEEWQGLISLAEDHSITILSDEVYRGSEHDQRSMLPPMADELESSISLGVMSKSLGLAGLRIGWAAISDPIIRRRFLAFKDYTTICNSAPSELLATIALRQRETILARNRNIISENLKTLHSFFDQYSDLLTWSPPKAGSTAFPRLRQDDDIGIFCDQVREEQGILLMPGTVFGVNTPHFRVGYGKRDMARVLGRFEQYVQARM